MSFRRQLAAAACLAALALAPRAEALTPPQAPAVLFTTGGNPVVAKLQFAGVQAYSLKGAQYSSFSAIPGASFSRNSAAYSINATRSNFVRNSTMVGAGPGVWPTNWSTFSGNGLTITPTGTVVDNGFTCVTANVTGTTNATGGLFVYLDTSQGIPAASGQTWTNSVYYRVISGSTSGVATVGASGEEDNSGGGFLSGSSFSTQVAPSMAFTRLTTTKTLGNSATAYSKPSFSLLATGTGVTVNMGLELCAPGYEHGPTANAWLPTSGSAVTINDPAGYDLSLVYFPTRTNYLRNSTNVGANAGSNTLPTYLGMGSANNGISRSVVGFGTENNLPYLDLNFSGTATSSFNFYLNLESAATIAAANGQAWSLSLYDRLLSGTSGSMTLGVQMQNSGGTGLGGDITQSIGTPGAFNRYSLNATLNNASTAFIQPYVAFSFASGVAYNFTTRLYGLFLEKQQTPAPVGGYPSAFISTAGATVSVNDMRVTDLGFNKEDATTNLFGFSRGSFSNASAWAVNGGMTATDNTVTAPDGTLTASTINDGTTANSTPGLASLGSTTVTAGNSYAMSVFGKAGTNPYIQLFMSNAQFTGNGYATFNLQTCSVAQSGGTITALGTQQFVNGWCRVWLSLPATTSGTINAGPQWTESAVLGRKPTFTPTGLTTYLWGFDVEQGAAPTSYCDAPTAALCTRAADVAYILNLPTLPSYTLRARGLAHIVTAATPQYLGMYDGGSDASRAYLAIANTQHQAQLLNGGTNTYTGTTTGTVQAGVASTDAASFAPGIQNMAAVGVLGVTGTGPAAALPGGFNRLDIGDNVSLTRPFNGFVQMLELDEYGEPPAKLQSTSTH